MCGRELLPSTLVPALMVISRRGPDRPGAQEPINGF